MGGRSRDADERVADAMADLMEALADMAKAAARQAVEDGRSMRRIETEQQERRRGFEKDWSRPDDWWHSRSPVRWTSGNGCHDEGRTAE